MPKCKLFVTSGRPQKFAVLSQRSSGAWQVRKSHVQRWCSEPKKLSIAAVGVTRAVRLRMYRSYCYYQTSYVRLTIVCEANLLFSFLIVCEHHTSHEGRSWRPKFDLQFFLSRRNQVYGYGKIRCTHTFLAWSAWLCDEITFFKAVWKRRENLANCSRWGAWIFLSQLYSCILDSP